MRKYFVRANTADGCINLIDKNIGDIKNIYILSGRSESTKGKILENLARKRENCECIYSPFEIGKPDGVIFRDTKSAVLDEEICEGILGKTVEIKGGLGADEEEKSKSKAAIEEFYRAYKEAKMIHDEWEKIYIGRMDFKRLNEYTKGVLDQLVGNKTGKEGTYKYERFFGASAPDGSVNYIENLTEKVGKRYFIKGRPGTGKSTFLKKLAFTAIEHGFGCEVYYCSFDKNSLDMVLVPELSVCVFDSTAPHELFPERDGDVVLDFYEEAGLSGTDEDMQEELIEISRKYKKKMSEGLCFLRLAKIYAAGPEFTDEEYIVAETERICRGIGI